MYRFQYFLKAALHNIGINRSSAFFAVLTTTLTLTLFGIFLFFYDNSRNWIASLQKDVEISVYLRETLSKNEMRSIEKNLKTDPRVLSWRYLSKDDALRLFQGKFSGEALLQHLGGNPLPASFEVNIRPAHQNPQDMKTIAADFGKWSGVEDVEYGAEWLKHFSDFLVTLKYLGLGLGGGLIIAVITIIAHAIRLHFYDRSEEVEIMKLIGATHRFIKNPFLFEGVLLGFLGSVLACLALFGLFRFVEIRLADFGSLLGQQVRVHFLPPYVIAGMIASGAILGGMGGELSLTYLLRFRTKNMPKVRSRRGSGRLVVLFSLLMGATVPAVWGQTSTTGLDPSKLDTSKKELQRVEQEIKQKEAKKKTLQKDEQSILATLDDMDRRLRSYQKTIDTLSHKIKKKEGEREYVSETLEALEMSIAERRALLARRVRMLYTEGAESVLAVLIPSPTYPLFLKRIHYLKGIANKEADMISVLHEELMQWEAKNKQIGALTGQLVAAQKPLSSKIQDADEERAKKRLLLDRIRDEKTYYEQAIAELDKSSSELKHLIKKLEEERRRREALKPPPVLPPTGRFISAKGKLLWPNVGPITSVFGRQKHPRFDTYIFKKGIEIEASSEKIIRAVYSGTVVYADWFKGYGLMIILDHGEDYYSVYGYLAKLFVTVGQVVEADRMIGAVGETGLSDGKRLYFELRYKGEPMDPTAWLQNRK